MGAKDVGAGLSPSSQTPPAWYGHHLQGYSRATTRSAGRVWRFSKQRGASRVASGGGVRNVTGLVGSGQILLHVTGRAISPWGPIRPPSGNLTRLKPWPFCSFVEKVRHVNMTCCQTGFSLFFLQAVYFSSLYMVPSGSAASVTLNIFR